MTHKRILDMTKSEYRAFVRRLEKRYAPDIPWEKLPLQRASQRGRPKIKQSDVVRYRRPKRTKKLDTVLNHLFTTEERAEIRQRAKEKLAGLQLQRLREARRLTKEKVAQAMGVSQAALSKLESWPNVTIGVLQRYVEAIGGRLEVNAVFGSPRPRRGVRVLRNNS